MYFLQTIHSTGKVFPHEINTQKIAIYFRRFFVVCVCVWSVCVSKEHKTERNKLYNERSSASLDGFWQEEEDMALHNFDSDNMYAPYASYAFAWLVCCFVMVCIKICTLAFIYCSKCSKFNIS